MVSGTAFWSRGRFAIGIACAGAFDKIAGEQFVIREPSMSEPIILEMYTDYV